MNIIYIISAMIIYWSFNKNQNQNKQRKYNKISTVVIWVVEELWD